jgi:hypothetical protein
MLFPQRMTAEDEEGVRAMTEALIDQVLGWHGRGRRYQLSIKHNAKTKRLIAAIGDSIPAKGKAARKRPR